MILISTIRVIYISFIRRSVPLLTSAELSHIFYLYMYRLISTISSNNIWIHTYEMQMIFYDFMIIIYTHTHTYLYIYVTQWTLCAYFFLSYLIRRIDADRGDHNKLYHYYYRIRKTGTSSELTSKMMIKKFCIAFSNESNDNLRWHLNYKIHEYLIISCEKNELCAKNRFIDFWKLFY